MMPNVRHNCPMLCATILLLRVSVALGSGTPATLPTTQPMDLSTPKAMMLSYDRLAGDDPAAFVPFYATHNPEEEKLVAAEARSEAMYGLLQVMVQEKWGNDGMNTVLRAFGVKTRDDIVAGTVDVDGETARFVWSDDTPAIDLVKKDGGWRIDATKFKNSLGMSVDDYVDSLHDMSPVLSDIADGIDQGKLGTPAAAAAEVERRLKAMNR
jgi:uncharacterized protein YunC (DUF1805 family)